MKKQVQNQEFLDAVNSELDKLLGLVKEANEIRDEADKQFANIAGVNDLEELGEEYDYEGDDGSVDELDEEEDEELEEENLNFDGEEVPEGFEGI